MRIDRNQTIAGMPILRVRDLLRKLSGVPFSSAILAKRAEISGAKGARLVLELGKLELIKHVSLRDGTPYYELTAAGERLCAARGTPPMSRAKAKKLLEAFLKRVRLVNRTNALAWCVERVTVFGSYLSDSADVGDLDLCVELSWRDKRRERWAYNKERIMLSGRRPRNTLEELMFSNIEVLKILKARSPYISFHEVESLEGIEMKKVVFERKKKR